MRCWTVIMPLPNMGSKELLLMLTNDDGASASGLLALKQELSTVGRVIIVAPDKERSAVGHGITIHHPMRIFEIGEDHFALSGTPTDCVIFGLRKLLKRSPDLVVSGINHGPNLGDDIFYSGTVAAAREAAFHHVPAIAVSQVGGAVMPDFGPAARIVRYLISEVCPLPRGSFLNVNIPEGNPVKYRFTRQGSKSIAAGPILEKRDPRGRKYFWIGPDESQWIIEEGSDYHAISQGAISVTPLQRDQTDRAALKSWGRDDRDLSLSADFPKDFQLIEQGS